MNNNNCSSSSSSSANNGSPRLLNPLLQALSSLYGVVVVDNHHPPQQTLEDYRCGHDTQTTLLVQNHLYRNHTNSDQNHSTGNDYSITVHSQHHPLLHGTATIGTTATAATTTAATATKNQHDKNVHSFLLWIQTRNIRRKVQSIYQQHCDSPPQQHHEFQDATTTTASTSTAGTTTGSEVVYMGSSWLACLAILVNSSGCSSRSGCNTSGSGSTSSTSASTGTNSISTLQSTQSSQAMFAIQTMLHRIRRVKINEAIDIEIEDWYDTNQKVQLLQQYSTLLLHQHQQQPNGSLSAATTTTLFLTSLCQRYAIHMQQMNSIMGQIIYDTVIVRSIGMMSSSSSLVQEEQIKAELSIMTLGIAVYQLSLQKVNVLFHPPTATTTTTMNGSIPSSATGTITPLLSMTVSTLATIVFRWWYTCCCCCCDTSNTEITAKTTISLVSIIQQTYHQITECTIRYNHTDTTRTNNRHVTVDDTYIHIAMSVSLLCTIAALPDAILASPGGARGRLSIDPRAIQIGSTILRQRDTDEFATIVMNEYNIYRNHQNTTYRNIIDQYILYACERWVMYLPLNHTILSLIQPCLIINSSNNTPINTLSVLIAIYESATWTIDQIVSSYIGLSSSDQQQSQQNHNSVKKKQSSRSKKRHKEIVDSHSTDQLRDDAIAEMKLRGDIAYHITIHCWNHLCQMTNDTIEAIHTHHYSSVPVEGEGPIGCMTACANACLPHIIRYSNIVHGSELFHSISLQVQRICNSNNKSIRALAYEPLYTLHTVLLDVCNEDPSTSDMAVQTVVVDHFCHCAMNLASLCAYPTNYFDHLCIESDHDLEIERNDVRDLLRTVSGPNIEYVAGVTAYPSDISIRILSKIIHSCNDIVQTTRQRQEVIPETIVHAFSALAKPINHLSKCFLQQQSTNPDQQATSTRTILTTALQVLLEVNRYTVDAFLHLSLSSHLLLPISRTVNIGNASFAPFLAALSSLSDVDISEGIQKLLDCIILVSILSLEQIPELAGPSILDHFLYDIRGTMCGPGGADHVGCLAFMRCVHDDRTLACRMIVSSVPYIGRLCDLHQTLKQIEVERGPMIVHGRGVTPQTRRILLGTICHLEVISQGQLGAYSMLNRLFIVAIDGIAQFYAIIAKLTQMDMFQISAYTLDIVAFTPSIVATLFDSMEPRYSECLDVLTSSFVNGYHMLDTDGSIVQWNRQRASLFALIKKSAQSTMDVSERAAAITIACVKSECAAISRQCMIGPSSTSIIFTEEAVSPESIPAGVMIKVLADVVSLSSSTITTLQHHNTLPFPNCLRTLTMIKDTVLSTMALTCPDPQCHSGAFLDPRPTVAEAWLQAMIALSEFVSKKQKSPHSDEPSEAEVLLMETFVTIIALLFYSSLGKTTSERARDPGMSLDGPHGLAIMIFFISYFRLPPRMLQWAGERLRATVPVNLESARSFDVDPTLVGIAIVGAALFRACQGALPPWAIESVPEVFSALFGNGLGNEVETFGRWIHLSMELRLYTSAEKLVGFGGLLSGQLLSGHYFETMSNPAKLAFVNEAMQLAASNGGADWRRLKGLIKQACGGKKKDTDFNQKPSPTRWEFDRV